MKKIWMVWWPDRDGSKLDSFWDNMEQANLRLDKLGCGWQVDEFDVGILLNTYL